MLPKQFACRNIIRKDLLTEHNGFCDARRLEVWHPIREGVDRVPVQARTFKIIVRPIVWPGITGLDCFELCKRLLRGIALCYPFAIFYKCIPKITILVSQRHRSCAKKRASINRNIPPTQCLSAGRSGYLEFTPCSTCLSVKLQDTIISCDEY